MSVTKPDIAEVRALMKRMHDEGHMTRAHYLKCLIGLAYETAAAEDITTTKSLLSECNEAYLKESLPDQMREDERFREVASFVARKLAEAGVSNEEQDDRLLESLAKVGQA